MLDLAIASIAMVVFEVVPSSYVVFKAQDDPAWDRALAAQLLMNLFLVVAVVSVVSVTGWAFFSFTHWITLYAACMAVKRFLDLRLQAHGRVIGLFGLDLAASVIRVLMLPALVSAGVAGADAAWASLALSFLMVQCWCLVVRRNAEASIDGAISPASWRLLVTGVAQYRPYYVNVLLKRVRDNMAPLVAERVIQSKDALAVFLLAYRGVLVAASQIRMFEAILSHRAMIGHVRSLDSRAVMLAAAAAQGACLVLCVAILLASGIDESHWAEIAVLSCLIWPITLSIAERATAYADFQAWRVSRSLLAYVVLLPLLAAILTAADTATALGFSCALLAAEVASYGAIRTGMRVK
jgi:hypothetical protein